MPYVLGTDEAGYGPNLGPLVIAASLWKVPAAYLDGNLYELFHPAIEPIHVPTNIRAVVVADSKRLYSTRRGMSELERGVLALAGTLGLQPSNDGELWPALDEGDAATQRAELPWHRQAVNVPHAAVAADLPLLSEMLERQFEGCGGKLMGMAAAALYPAEFNRLVRHHGTKSEVLSQTTLQLAARLMPQTDEPVLVLCDKHGGRGKYTALLMRQFASSLVEVLCESRPISAYRMMGADGGTIEFRFQMGAEQFLPAALASMIAKYLRELSMLAFNRFWQSHLPQLKPTAGYPQDARRYQVEISATQRQLAIADELLWRVK
jgi:hypothetical protein